MGERAQRRSECEPAAGRTARAAGPGPRHDALDGNRSHVGADSQRGTDSQRGADAQCDTDSRHGADSQRGAEVVRADEVHIVRAQRPRHARRGRLEASGESMTRA